MVDALKSQAVIIYTGKGRSAFPLGDLDAVRVFGAARADELTSYVRSVVDEMFALYPLDWGERNSVPATQVMQAIESRISERHPELSSEAAAALAWLWSYSSWK